MDPGGSRGNSCAVWELLTIILTERHNHGGKTPRCSAPVEGRTSVCRIPPRTANLDSCVRAGRANYSQMHECHPVARAARPASQRLVPISMCSERSMNAMMVKERKQPTTRVAIYARVSSDQQVQQGTIDSQVLALRQRVQADGQTLEDELCFVDDGYSGSTLVRPALERLRDVAWAGPHHCQKCMPRSNNTSKW